MARYSIDGQILTDIADAINEKTGGTNLMAPGAMADAISRISGGGVTVEPLVSASVTIPGDKQYSISVDLPKSVEQVIIMIEAEADALSSMGESTDNYYSIVGAVVCCPVPSVTIGEASHLICNSMLRYRPSKKVATNYTFNGISIANNVLTLSTDVTTSFIGGGSYKVTVWEVDTQ